MENNKKRVKTRRFWHTNRHRCRLSARIALAIAILLILFWLVVLAAGRYFAVGTTPVNQATAPV